VGRNASNVRQSVPTRQERPHSYINTIDQHDNRPDEEYDDDEVNPSIYHIKERYMGDPVLSQFRGFYYFVSA